MFPLVASNNAPAELVEPAVATFTLNTTLPKLVEAKTAILPVVVDAVNTVLALPFALVVADDEDSEPPLAVVTAKFTLTPETGVPALFVAMISRGIGAAELGVIDCPLPEEMVITEPVPDAIVVRLNTALPADEVAMMLTGPSWDEAVKATLARPSAAVVAVAVVAPPVRVPAPEVMTLKVTVVLPIGFPKLLSAVTSSDLVAVVPCSTD